MPLTEAAIGGIVSGAAALANVTSQAITNSRNRELQERVNRASINQIKEQNAYNAPVNQIARLRGAGLNPALVYGDSSAGAAGNQSDIANLESPVLSPVDFSGPINAAGQMALAVRQQKNNNMMALADLGLKNAQSFLAVTAGEKNQALIDQIVQDMGFDRERFPLECAEINQRIVESKSRELLNYKTIELNNSQIDLVASQTGLNNARVREIIELLPHRIAEMDSQTFLNYMKGNEAKEMVAVAWSRFTIDKDMNEYLQGHYDRQDAIARYRYDLDNFLGTSGLNLQKEQFGWKMLANFISDITKVGIAVAGINHVGSSTVTVTPDYTVSSSQ